ncbi:XrtA system polysaccharide deacetylase [Crenalkalicoccus roseus]|uniref:XrtA system polysaccharide deacetylase n=1 Tax=Crenalkalicoccus roseus TaxID=1485588 RepID=UPI001F00C7D8|nr:XrtA system polysaccharide deacetylase [Crenalkalicoccus roseus]
MSLRNAMTVDVEDWFQVQAFAGVIPPQAWEGKERRVVASTGHVLDLFAEAGVRATFFTLGWVAERHPALIRRILAEGHELASHGYGHAPVFRLGPEGFRQDIRRAKQVLEDAGGVAVLGYRAPTFSISPQATPWAHRILAEEGHRYSSSVFPGRHAARGDGAAALLPWQADGVLEVPMTVLRSPLRDLPVSGGGWFRMTPYGAFRAGLRRVNAMGRRGVFYFHPWEVDPDQPRVAEAPALARLRHYTGLRRMAPRLRALLRDFAWGRMDEVFAPELGATAPRRMAA